jgi:hypothetical protein
MKRHITLAALISSILAGATSAYAANCAKREMVVDRLQDKYSEQLTAGGLQASRTATAVVEVWTSAETGTFTVILTNAHGVSCIVASGTDWHADKLVKRPKGTAS